MFGGLVDLLMDRLGDRLIGWRPGVGGVGGVGGIGRAGRSGV